MASTFKISQDGRPEKLFVRFNIDALNTNIIVKEAHIYGDLEGFSLETIQVSNNSIAVDISSSDNPIISNPTEIPITMIIKISNISDGDYLLLQMADMASTTIISDWRDDAILECTDASVSNGAISYDISCLKEKTTIIHPQITFKDNSFSDTIVLPVEIICEFE